MIKLFKVVKKSQRGAELIEASLLTALVAIAVFHAVDSIGITVWCEFDAVQAELDQDRTKIFTSLDLCDRWKGGESGVLTSLRRRMKNGNF